jgi:putative ABC transport system permease protein
MLSLLGITIGIFTIISVFSAVDTLRNKLQASVDKLGSNTLFVQKWPWVFGGDFPWWKYINRPEPSLRDYEALKDRLDHVDGISFEASTGNRVVKYRSNSVEGVNLSAVSQDYDKTWTLDFQEGRYFTENEGKSSAPVVLLGAEVANGLFDGEPAVGKQIKVMGRRLTVVGVFKKEGDDMLGMSQDNNVVIPLTFARGLFDVQNEQYNPQITVRGKESVALEEVESELHGAMRSIRRLAPGAEDDFSLNQTTMLSNQLDIMFKMVNIAGWVIGGFSILVGGFGIANIMFVSVKERTNIIGIQKSLGAKNYFILLQFMFEAVALCLMGGALGLLLVYGITLIFTYVVDVKIVLDINNIIMGVSISAFSASRLDPGEAIRS